jgi:hypothetical protein
VGLNVVILPPQNVNIDSPPKVPGCPGGPGFPSAPVGPLSPWRPSGPGSPCGPRGPFLPIGFSASCPFSPALPGGPSFPGGPPGPWSPGMPKMGGSCFYTDSQVLKVKKVHLELRRDPAFPAIPLGHACLDPRVGQPLRVDLEAPRDSATKII